MNNEKKQWPRNKWRCKRWRWGGRVTTLSLSTVQLSTSRVFKDGITGHWLDLSLGSTPWKPSVDEQEGRIWVSPPVEYRWFPQLSVKLPQFPPSVPWQWSHVEAVRVSQSRPSTVLTQELTRRRSWMWNRYKLIPPRWAQSSGGLQSVSCVQCVNNTLGDLTEKVECDDSAAPPVGLIEGCCGTFHQQVGLVYAHVCVCVSWFDGRRVSSSTKRQKTEARRCSGVEGSCLFWCKLVSL